MTAGGELEVRNDGTPDVRIPDAEIVDLPVRPELPAVADRPKPIPAPWQTTAVERRPVVASWLQTAEQRGQAARWAVGHACYVLLFHIARVPLYALRVALWSPRGACRLVGRYVGWLLDVDSWPMIWQAKEAKSIPEYRGLRKESAKRVKPRLVGLAVWLAVAVAVLAWMVLAQMTLLLWLVAAVAVGACARAGQNPDRPLMEHAVVEGRFRKLSSGIVMRSFIAAKLCTEDEPITFCGPIQRDGAGWTFIVDLPFGRTATQAMTAREKIASGLDVDERCLFLQRIRGASGSARRVKGWTADEDPLTVPAGPSPLIDATRVNFWDGFDWGVDERGTVIRLNLLWQSMLVGAIPRQGKSFSARAIGLAAAMDPHVRLHVYDMKGSPDWTCFRHVAHRWQLGDTPDPETGVDPVRALLEDLTELRAEVNERYRALRRLPVSLCPQGKLTEELARNAQVGMPLVLFIVDEVQRAFKHKELGKQLEELLEDLVKVAPGAGIIMLCATQKPDKDSTPTSFRDQFSIRFALRVTTYHASEAILGQGAYGEGLDASKLAPEAKGAGLLRGTGDDGDVVAGGTVRTYLADGEDAEVICLRARELRLGHHTLSGAALGDMPMSGATGPDWSVGEDVLIAMGPDDQTHSDVLCARLATQWPDRYPGWTPRQLQAALSAAPFKVSTRQVWADALDGERRNRKGVRRAELVDALGGAQDDEQAS